MTVHADDSRAASATIGSAGGTIQTTGADGSRYTLTVPKNAVDDGTHITLTPVQSLGALPLDGLVAATRLQPEGLQFNIPATLEIDFPAAVPVSRQLAFASQGDGAEWHLYPQTFDPHRAVLQLLHFSEYGVGTGGAAAVVAAVQHPPTSWQAQAEQLREMLAQERQAELAGDPHPYSPQQIIDQMAGVLRSQYAQAVEPALRQLETSDDETAIAAASSTVLAWLRQVQLMGLDTLDETKAEFAPRTQGLLDAIIKAIARLYTRAESECGTGARQLVNGGQLGWFVDSEGAKRLLKYARTLQLLAGESAPGDPLFTALEHCRPRGFIVPPITLKWTWTSTAEIDETHTVSGHVCGSDPTAHPWSFHFERQSVALGQTLDSHGADFSMTLNTSMVFLPPPEHNNPSDLASIFGADFFGGSQVSMQIVGETDPQVRLATHNLDSSYGGVSLNPVDNSGTVPLQEDMSCPLS